jgi:hypothetical protein
MGRMYAGKMTVLDTGETVVLGPDERQRVAALDLDRPEPRVLVGQFRQRQDQRCDEPSITIRAGGSDTAPPTVMKDSDFGWSMSEDGDDGVADVPGEQAAFEELLPEEGKDDIATVLAENVALLRDKIAQALSNGLPPSLESKLRAAIKLVNCRERLGADGGMKVARARCSVFPEEWVKLNRKSKIPLRAYSAEQRKWLSDFVARLLKAGIIRRTLTNSHCSPAMVVQKPGGRGWRLVVDLRLSNRVLVKHLSPCLALHQVLHFLAGATCFTMYDVGDAFWKLPVEDKLGELTTFSAVDEDGKPATYAMCRAAQGSINSSADFSIALQEVLKPMLGVNALVYIDDVLLYAKDPEALVDANAQFHDLIERATSRSS